MDVTRRSRRPRSTATAFAIVAAGVLLSIRADPGGAGAAETFPPCPRDSDAATDLHCVDLLPAAGIADIEARLELLPGASPFGVAVSRTGAPRRRLVLDLRGLPEPSELGPYEGYVAWATTPRLHPMVRLGEVTDGRNELGEVAFNRFLVLVSAEEDVRTENRDGRLVLRGTSPSLRLHPQEYGSFLGTAIARDGEPADDGAAEAPMDDGAAPGGAASGAWSGPPPMPPELQPIPGLAGLRPSVLPFRPAGEPDSLPLASPGGTLELSDGDTLRLEARPVRFRAAGATLLGYGYNGRIPGPLIRVPEGAEITVMFRNAIDLPTTVHWHGLRLENAFDGVPGITQAPVEPGEDFTYRVRFPDAGLYWYHPHVREDIQQDLGLYGNIRVDPGSGDWFNPVNREEVLVVDDLLVADDAPLAWGREAATHAMMGRFGNVLLVNGRERWNARVRAGEVVRLFLTNVANTRVFHLVLEGAEMKVVATDLGRFPREERVEGVVLSPAERYVVEARFPEPGTYALTNRVQGIDHVRGGFYAEVDTLGTVEVTGPPVRGAEDHETSFRRLRSLDSLRTEIEALGPWRDRPPDHRLVLTMEAGALPFPLGPMMRADSLWFAPVEWTGSMPVSNWVTTPREARWILRDPETGRENMEIGWRFRQGDTVKVKLVNDRDAFHAMQHPIHLHGQRFLVLSRDGVPQENPAWKDTALVPVGSTAELLVELTNPGDWMLHCHISEHLEAGMRTVLTVEPAVPPDGPGAQTRKGATP